MSEPLDISQKVLSLAREIDRLPAGDYSITLRKPRGRSESWSVKITKTEQIKTMNIPASARIVETHEGRMGQASGEKL
jgi:hypothetical protein